MTHTDSLLVGTDLCRSYRKVSRLSRARTEVAPALVLASIEVRRGQTVMVVGESGSGKTTLSRILLGLDQPTSGTVKFRDVELGTMTREERHAFRRAVQPVFQDPSASLNPRKRIVQIVGSPLLRHRMATRQSVRQVVATHLEAVGLRPAESFLDRLPSQLSGGQQQRVAIARAFALEPDVVIADEALSSLDVTVQSQILTLMRSLQRETGVGYVLVTHDLAVARAFGDEVVVMRSGAVVERGPAKNVLSEPAHAYTRELLAAELSLNPGGGPRLKAALS